jgi:mono/diheme cytochrome c family protein
MTTYPHTISEAVPASGTAAVAPLCPKPAAVKAKAKALRKWRKHERLRFFFSWCAGCHVLGFSF